MTKGDFMTPVWPLLNDPSISSLHKTLLDPHASIYPNIENNRNGLFWAWNSSIILCCVLYRII